MKPPPPLLRRSVSGPPALRSRVGSVVHAGLLVLVTLLPWAHTATAAPLERAAVMAPLLVRDDQWDDFRRQLADAKAIGVDAVSTDVWWGLVERAGDQRFDWSYYDRVSAAITGAGLRWVPILSFHECGPNVGDDVRVPLPSWIWTRHPEAADALRYRSEQGNVCEEVVSLWADAVIARQYREFMEAFRDHFAGRAGSIAEINLGAGPSGELRYPSYNGHDRDAGYPHRGALQCYGPAAEASFRSAMLRRHGSLQGVNRAWGLALTSADQIRVPDDANAFFARRDHVGTAYGRDLLAWYNQSLIDHGRLIVRLGQEVFTGPYANIPLGIKIPGVHWRMADPERPRLAEICAGLVPTHIDFQSDATARGYAPILDFVREMNTGPRRVVLHFTCLEMGNENRADAWSQAENLVFWVAAGAAARGVTIMGENALDGGVGNDFGWGRIDNAFRYASYTGLTVLRIGQVTSNDFGRSRYESFIRNHRPVTSPAPHEQTAALVRKTRRGPR